MKLDRSNDAWEYAGAGAGLVSVDDREGSQGQEQQKGKKIL